MPIAPDWRSVREVIEMLHTAAAGGGNLLLNIGPAPDGSVPAEAVERLEAVGKWLETYGEAVYGQVDRADGRMEWMPTGGWTLKGNTAYFWCSRWPGQELAIGGLHASRAQGDTARQRRHGRLRADGEPAGLARPARNTTPTPSPAFPSSSWNAMRRPPRSSAQATSSSNNF